MDVDYAGVLWSKDLAWRDGQWVVHPRHTVTDYLKLTEGNSQRSLLSLIAHDPSEAVNLLKNKYYILLTRATKGVYIYCEDAETAEHLEWNGFVVTREDRFKDAI
jgi:uncharacterized protein